MRSHEVPRRPILISAALLALLTGGAALVFARTTAATQTSQEAEKAKPPAASAASNTAATATAAPPTGAQPAEGEGEFFSESVDVNVVNVDVFVTDKAGNRVTDLKREDFELFEDKKPVLVTNFYSIEGGKARADASADGGAPLQVDATLGRSPADIPDDQKLSLIVYVDNFNLRPFNRNRVLRELRQFLNEKVRPGDRVMLVTYDRELHVRRPFTTDPSSVASALFELEKLSAQGTHTDSDRKDILSAIDEAEDVQQVYGQARSYAESLFNDLEFTIGALKGFVDELAGLPGRKALIYVSDGIPMRAAEDIFYAMSIKFPQQTSLLEVQSYDASRRYSELANQANANRVSFYAIEATGLRVSSAADASQSNPGLGVQVEQIHFSNLQSPLQSLAERTGGAVILNANQILPRLIKIAEDFDTYYSLGYQPSHSGDGRYHRIEVKVKRKGLRVRHREGYRDKPLENRMSDGLLATLRFGGESNSMGVGLEVGEMIRRSDGLYTVQLGVRIPIGKMLLVPRETMHEGRLRVYVAAMDREGGTSEVGNSPVPISIPLAELEEASKQFFAYSLTLVMRKGEQKVAVAVRDDLSGATAYVTRALTVGP